MLGAPGAVAFLDPAHLCGFVFAVAVAADRPWAEDVSEGEDVVEVFVADGISGLLAPVVGDAEHDAHASPLRIVFEEADEPLGLFQSVAAVVVEADPPDGDEWFAVQLEVGRIVGIGAKFHAGAEKLPIFREAFEVVVVEAGEVVHEDPAALVFDGGVAAEEELLVLEEEAAIVATLLCSVHAETLYEGTVDFVFPHPGKVAVDGLGVDGAEHFGHAAVAVLEWSWETFVFIEIGEVGPKVNRARARFEFAALLVVIESESRAVTFGAEPALVTGDEFACQSGWFGGGRSELRGRFENIVGLSARDLLGEDAQ